MNKAVITIMQGDQYAIPFEILKEDGTAACADDFTEVEIVVGSLQKRLTEGGIEYSGVSGVFLFPLTQAETFAMRNMPQDIMLRVKTVAGDVIGMSLGQMIVDLSLSTEVL